jgi:transposase
VNHASTKLISEYLHKAGKGYKSISKSLDVHQSTVRQIIYELRKFSTVATLPRGGRPAKMTARAHHRIAQ